MATQAAGTRLNQSPTAAINGVERCSECGFDGGTTTTPEAILILSELPDWWAAVIMGVSTTDLGSRPIIGMWSIAEYTDHVREVAFGMGFVLDTAIQSPGLDLGESPTPIFTEAPQPISTAAALDRFRSEIEQLVDSLQGLSPEQQRRTVTIDSSVVNSAWVVRHAVHDITHHIGDIQRLKESLSRT